MADAKNLNIAYIGGGSMNFGWKLIGELAGEEQLGGTVRLYDTDKQAALANEVIGNKLRENPAAKGGFIYLAADTLEEALKNADFVIISITPGTLEEIVSDIHIPEMFGIYQPVGDSAGPGGIVRAVRTLPVYIKIAEEIKKLCPDAWVINLTHPMSVCLGVLYKVFPQIKAFGSSSEPFSAQELLAELAAKEFGVSAVCKKEIKTNLIGINNFSWVNEANYQGNSLMDVFRKYAEICARTGYEKRAGEFKTNPYASANMIRFDLFLRYGLIPAQSDRYSAEFCPPWYLKNPKVVSTWKFGLMSVNYLRRRKSERLQRSKRLMSGEEQLRIGPSGSDCVLQIKALLGLGNLISNADLPNSGQVCNLPAGAIVQTNALFSHNSIKPVAAGTLPDEIYALTIRHVINQQTVIKSVFEKDLDIAFNAFLNDPLVTIDLASATELYKEMLSSIRAHLIYYC
jgi:alpha-galactosidase